MDSTTPKTMTEADALWLEQYRQKEEIRKQKRRASRILNRAKMLEYERTWRAKPANKEKIKAKNAKVAERVKADKQHYLELLRAEAARSVAAVSGVAA